MPDRVKVTRSQVLAAQLLERLCGDVLIGIARIAQAGRDAGINLPEHRRKSDYTLAGPSKGGSE